MGDFYLDDQFYDHPKALAAGEDAANLFPRIVAWAHRHNTGRIPKEAVCRLTTKRTSPLVAALVRVNLLHDGGDSWEIHDWTTRNAKMIAKREAAKKAAAAKWKKFYEDQANADANAEESHSEPGADPLPNQPRSQGTKEAAASEVFTHNGCGKPAAAALPEVVKEAFGIIIARRLAAHPPDNPAAYTAHLWKALPADHADRLATLDVGTFTPEQLAELLEPVVSPKPRFDAVGATTTTDGRTFLPGTGWVS